MLYVYDAKLEINGLDAQCLIDHSEKYLLNFLIERKDATKLWYFYKYTNNITTPLTINYNHIADSFLFSPGFNRYYGMFLAGKKYAEVRVVSTIDYQFFENKISLLNLKKSESIISVILHSMNHNQYYNVEVKNINDVYIDYHSTIKEGINFYQNSTLLFHVGYYLETNKQVEMNSNLSFIDNLKFVFNQVVI